MRFSTSFGIAAALAAAPLLARGDVTFLNSWGTPGTGPGQFSYPYGVAVAPSGNVYVTEQVNQPGYVSVFSPTGTYITRFTGTGTIAASHLAGTAINSAGVGYVAINSLSNEKLLTYSTTSSGITGAWQGGSGTTQFSSVADVAVNSLNDVLLLDDAVRRVVQYNSSGTYETTFGSAGQWQRAIHHALGHCGRNRGPGLRVGRFAQSRDHL